MRKIHRRDVEIDESSNYWTIQSFQLQKTIYLGEKKDSQKSRLLEDTLIDDLPVFHAKLLTKLCTL